MQHITTYTDALLAGAWITIGVFDGVHRGHQAMIRSLAAAAHAAGAPAAVVTFWPHPVQVLRPAAAPPFLTNPEERAARLAPLGVDLVYTHPFDRAVAALPARDFLQNLQAMLAFRQLWVGHDFALGRNREGDIPALTALGQELGYALRVFEPVLHAGERISSSQARALLLAGELSAANALLGQLYQLSGPVVEGARRGRTIGVPTANVSAPPGKLIPQNGVYACWAEHHGQRHPAVTNIGVRPTFDGSSPTVYIESHLLDYTGDLYGETLTLTFVERLRAEQRFPGIDALVAQIQRDIQHARQTLIPPAEAHAPVS